jgi:hypothetical protein
MLIVIYVLLQITIANWDFSSSGIDHVQFLLEAIYECSCFDHLKALFGYGWRQPYQIFCRSSLWTLIFMVAWTLFLVMVDVDHSEWIDFNNFRVDLLWCLSDVFAIVSNKYRTYVIAPQWNICFHPSQLVMACSGLWEWKSICWLSI